MQLQTIKYHLLTDPDSGRLNYVPSSLPSPALLTFSPATDSPAHSTGLRARPRGGMSFVMRPNVAAPPPSSPAASRSFQLKHLYYFGCRKKYARGTYFYPLFLLFMPVKYTFCYLLKKRRKKKWNIAVKM